MENIPVNDPTPSGWKPTASTQMSGLAGAAVQIAIFFLGKFHVELDAPTVGALTVIAMYIASYFHPDGGRK